MSGIYNKFLYFLKNVLGKIKPKFSFHYVAYTTLFFAVIFSFIHLVSATTPNPGHPWSELGDGVFVFTNSQTSTPYTYTFPAANTTVLTTNAAVTVAQGGTNLTSIASGSILAANSANTLSAVTSTSGTKVLTNTSGTITWETASSGMVYPGSGIANSTGSAWGTSYSTTGSGTVVALATSPTFSTSIFTPYVIGGTGTTSDLSLQTTSGVGATGADMHFLVGNNGGTEAMTILNDGKVGIGTSSPGNNLDVKGSGATTVKIDAGGDASLNLYSGSMDWYLYGNNTNKSLGIKISPGGSDLFTILGSSGSTGQIGIGVSSPTAILHLKAGTAGTAPLKLTSGTNLATPENGAIEYNGTHLYFTTGGTRYQLDQQSGTPSPITIVNSSNLFSTGLSGTGNGVTSTTNSIFLGVNAGNGATGAYSSNFIGYNAGNGGETSYESNFIGYNAGNGATSAEDANFIGVGAGYGATGAYSSTFIGYAAGNYATGAYESNFIGNLAGDYSSGAYSSNFFGSNAGYNAENAYKSTFFGLSAGNGATNASNSIFIGQQAGKDDTVNNTTDDDDWSILIGYNTNTGGFKNSILLGGSNSTTAIANTKTNQFMLAPTLTEMRLRGVDYTLPSAQGGASTVLTNNGSGGLSWSAGGGSMVYPGAGIAYSTGSAWGTSYTTSGSGTVLALTTSPVFTTPSLGVATGVSLDLSGGNFDLDNTTHSNQNGIITKNGTSFIHDFNYGNNGSVTTAGSNLFVGIGSGNFTMGSTATAGYESSYNIGVGYQSLQNNTKGYSNLAIGTNALNNNSEGNSNVAMGTNALYTNTTGYSNMAIGTQALYYNETGDSNVSIGTQSLYSNTMGALNTAIGANSLYSNTEGRNNLALGANSLYNNTVGEYNISIGTSSLSSNKAGSSAVAVGYNAMLYTNDTTTPFTNSSTAVGYEALRGSNTAANNTGVSNTALGYQSLFSITSGNYNVGLGDTTLYSNNTGSHNLAMGHSSMLLNTSGQQNTAIGSASLYANSDGYNNIAIGFDAAHYQADGTTPLTSAGSSIYIGHSVRGYNNSDINTIVIGNSAVGNGSNTVTIGNSSILRTYLRGVNLAAGTATAGTAPLKLTSGTNLTTPENGAIEYNGTHLYFTTGGTRYQLDQQSTGGGSALSGITAATTSASINSGDNAVTWNWALTTAAKTAFTIGENTASTNGAGSQSILDVSTLSGSTAAPLRVLSNGSTDIEFDLNSTGDFVVKGDHATQIFKIDSTGFVQIGTGSGSASPNIFVLDTGNTSGDPSGRNGGMYYNSNVSMFRCYRNGTWEDCGSVQNFIKLSSSYGTSSLPSLPSSGEVKLFSRTIASRVFPAFVGHSGLDTALQPLLARNKVGYWNPPGNATTAPGVFGFTSPTISNFTATSRTVATTNMFTRLRRLGYLTGTTAGIVGNWRVGVYQYTVGDSTTNLGGFTYIIRFGISDTTSVVSGARMFMGMRYSSTPSNVEPSTLTYCIGMGHGASDTTMHIYYGGSAAQTPIDLGSSFPSNTTSTDVYELALFSPPNSGNVSWQVTRLNTGDVASGTISNTGTTILPANTTLLAPWGYRTNNATAAAVGVDIMSAYIETDY